MGVLASGLQAFRRCLSLSFVPNNRGHDLESFDEAAALIISTVPTIASTRYRNSLSENMPSPSPSNTYCENFLSMMFGDEGGSREIPKSVSNALDLIFFTACGP